MMATRKATKKELSGFGDYDYDKTVTTTKKWMMMMVVVIVMVMMTMMIMTMNITMKPITTTIIMIKKCLAYNLYKYVVILNFVQKLPTDL